MPADGDGHANRQELLLILDEYWQANSHLQNIPIFYALKLLAKAPRVYRTFSNMMNARIRSQMDVGNPFSIRFIQNLKSIDINAFDDTGPSVVFAAPGMLQSAVSRQLFDRRAADPKNGVTYCRRLGDRDTRRCLPRR
jgi:cleavage and polyadenylation specificity factor subunit 3